MAAQHLSCSTIVVEFLAESNQAGIASKKLKTYKSG
jgi:hypothetical protein